MIYTHLDRLGPVHQYPKVIYDLLLDLQAQDLTQLELGSHDYGNQGIKLNVFEVQSQDNPDPNRMSECHHDHVDVQVSLAGHEVYGFAPYQEDNQLLEDRLEAEDVLLKPELSSSSSQMMCTGLLITTLASQLVAA